MAKRIAWAIGCFVFGAAVYLTIFKASQPEQVTTETPVTTPTEQPTAEPSIAASEPEAPQDVPTEATTPTPVPAAPKKAAGPPVDPKIQKAFDEALPVLRQKAAIAQSKNEDIVHNTPKQTIQAARQLGGIVELQEQHPEASASFLEFYRDCAEDEQVVTVTRAQCLDYYVKLAQLSAAEKSQFVATFPQEVTKLYEVLQ